MEIQFRLFGIPVHVSVVFLLIALVLGQQWGARTPVLMAAWIVVMFLGILMHELGHALTAKAYGQEPAIALHGFGGTTMWQPRGDIGPGKRAIITLAGPVVGIVIGVPALVLARLLPDGSFADQVMDFAWSVNLVWAIFNLVPMLPLDGGRVMASVLELLFGKGSLRVAYVVSIVVAVLFGLLMLLVGAYITLVFCAYFIYLNVQGLGQLRRPEDPPAIGA
ncbi:MAG TPA: site-2 protease family protein [Vicinamibacteria bacterium]|nr:site-2 protease family protein [Vicinamibacteria bacterium]